MVKDHDIVFVAAGSCIYATRNTKRIATLEGHTGTVEYLLMFGTSLVSLGRDNNMIMWNISTYKKEKVIEFPPNFHPTTCMHPDTYLNKVLVGSEEGTLALYNLRSQKLVYTFAGWGTRVTCIAQSPAVDVVGIGLADGRIFVHNLKLDRTLMTFLQAEGGITSLSFRTDAHPLLASGTPQGHVVLWNLEKKQLQAVMRDVHNTTIAHLEFFHNQPILITSSPDNSVKMWVFDSPSGIGRLLRKREGHSSPPRFVRFYGPRGRDIISAGGDQSLRYLSVLQDAQNREFSQAAIKKFAVSAGVDPDTHRLPPVVDMVVSLRQRVDVDGWPQIWFLSSQVPREGITVPPRHHLLGADIPLRKPTLELSFPPSHSMKEREWDSIVTCHEDNLNVFAWNFEHKSIGKHILTSTESNRTPIKAVCISACGNFAFLGSASGWIDKYNIQSGIHRGSCMPEGHGAAVVSLCCDVVNRFVISASLDSSIKYWDFATMELQHTTKLDGAVSKVVISQDNSLLAVVCDDLVVRLYDIDTRNVVRRFVGHSNQIIDLTFSADGRWLVTAGMDNTVRTWDVPTGRLIDWFSPSKPVTSLSFSPTNEFLATTHVGNVGVFLWSNHAHFATVLLGPIPELPPTLSLPTIGGNFTHQFEEEESDEETRDKKRKQPPDHVTEEENHLTPREITQLDKSLVTLSSFPKSKWQTLSDWDVIKKRNKVVAAQKQHEAPFFLPTVSSQCKRTSAYGSSLPTTPPLTDFFVTLVNIYGRFFPVTGIDPKFGAPKKEEEAPLTSEAVSFEGVGSTALIKLLSSQNYSEAFDYLKSLTPTDLDNEFTQSSRKHFTLILDFFGRQLATNRDFELTQAYLNRFLKLNSESIVGTKLLEERVRNLRKQQQMCWGHLEKVLHANLCLINYFSKMNV